MDVDRVVRAHPSWRAPLAGGGRYRHADFPAYAAGEGERIAVRYRPDGQVSAVPDSMLDQLPSDRVTATDDDGVLAVDVALAGDDATVAHDLTLASMVVRLYGDAQWYAETAGSRAHELEPDEEGIGPRGSIEIDSDVVDAGFLRRHADSIQDYLADAPDDGMVYAGDIGEEVDVAAGAVGRALSAASDVTGEQLHDEVWSTATRKRYRLERLHDLDFDHVLDAVAE